MSLNETLEDILKENALEKAEGSDGIILRERQAKMAVQVIHCPEPVTAIRLGKFSHLSVLKDGPRKQQCDYLLIVQRNGIIHAVFIELKKTLTQEERPKEQLRRSRPFLAYLLSVCEIESERSIARTRLTYIIIAEKRKERLDKQRVKIGPSRISLEQYRKIKIATIVGTTVSLADLTNS